MINVYSKRHLTPFNGEGGEELHNADHGVPINFTKEKKNPNASPTNETIK